MLRYAMTGGAILAVALTGCGSATHKQTSTSAVQSAATSIAAATSNVPQPNAPQPKPDQGPEGAVPGGPNAVVGAQGKAKLTIDGTVAGVTGPVQCPSNSQQVVIMIGNGPGANSAVATLALGSPPTVTAVAFNDVNGWFLAVGQEFGGSATATATADGYAIEGQANGSDPNNQDASGINFRIDVTCPNRGGGPS